MAILVIEGGRPDGTDFVMATKRLTAETFYVPIVLNGVPGILVVRAMVDDGRLRYLRSAHLLDAKGNAVPKTNDGYVDEQETING